MNVDVKRDRFSQEKEREREIEVEVFLSSTRRVISGSFSGLLSSSESL